MVKKEDLPLNANQAVSISRFIDCSSVVLKYFVYVINTPKIQKLLLKQNKVTAIPNLTLEIVANLLIPLPPLEEQKQIVKTIEALLPLCDKLGK